MLFTRNPSCIALALIKRSINSSFNERSQQVDKIMRSVIEKLLGEEESKTLQSTYHTHSF